MCLTSCVARPVESEPSVCCWQELPSKPSLRSGEGPEGCVLRSFGEWARAPKSGGVGRQLLADPTQRLRRESPRYRCEGSSISVATWFWMPPRARAILERGRREAVSLVDG